MIFPKKNILKRNIPKNKLKYFFFLIFLLPTVVNAAPRSSIAHNIEIINSARKFFENILFNGEDKNWKSFHTKFMLFLNIYNIENILETDDDDQ